MTTESERAGRSPPARGAAEMRARKGTRKLERCRMAASCRKGHRSPCWVPGRLGGKTFLHDLLHLFGEEIHFVRARIDVRRDTQPGELGVDDRSRHDPMLLPQV